ncbi:hypothetical protein SXCC_03624 [Gluconacetobacter sp. SXCC-1]|nr:hypothetical protein SXCC_03624 [Gluconacetobacter sp. SXCC-1]
MPGYRHGRAGCNSASIDTVSECGPATFYIPISMYDSLTFIRHNRDYVVYSIYKILINIIYQEFF